MELKKHAGEFKRIVEEYKLADKAEEIAEYMTKHQKISVKEFATLFNMKERDAQLFVSFISRGIKFRSS